MLYRGQKYGAPVGEWWTTSLAEAGKFAMAAGGNRTYVVLSLDQDLDEPWLAPFLYAAREGADRGSWYRIPRAQLRERWRGVRVTSGAISLESPGQPDEPSERELRHQIHDWFRMAWSALASDAPAGHRSRGIRQLLRAQVALHLEEDLDDGELLTKEVHEQCRNNEERGVLRAELLRIITGVLNSQAHAEEMFAGPAMSIGPAPPTLSREYQEPALIEGVRNDVVGARAVYADWLEEHGRTDRAMLLRGERTIAEAVIELLRWSSTIVKLPVDQTTRASSARVGSMIANWGTDENLRIDTVYAGGLIKTGDEVTVQRGDCFDLLRALAMAIASGYPHRRRMDPQREEWPESVRHARLVEFVVGILGGILGD